MFLGIKQLRQYCYPLLHIYAQTARSLTHIIGSITIQYFETRRINIRKFIVIRITLFIKKHSNMDIAYRHIFIETLQVTLLFLRFEFRLTQTHAYADNIGERGKPLVIFIRPVPISIHHIDTHISPYTVFINHGNDHKRFYMLCFQHHIVFFGFRRHIIQTEQDNRFAHK